MWSKPICAGTQHDQSSTDTSHEWLLTNTMMLFCSTCTSNLDMCSLQVHIATLCMKFTGLSSKASVKEGNRNFCIYPTEEG